jgi:hypothetical protein
MILVWSSRPLRAGKLLAAPVLQASCRQAGLPQVDLPRCVITQRLVHPLAVVELHITSQLLFGLPVRLVHRRPDVLLFQGSMQPFQQANQFRRAVADTHVSEALGSSPVARRR